MAENTNTSQRIGERIKAARKAKEMTQSMVLLRFVKTVSNWPPSLEFLAASFLENQTVP